MVAVIKSGRSISRILNYNENKVKLGVAKCILASNYPMDKENLSITHKLNRLINQAKLNENVKTNSIHISLNFAKDETLDEDKLIAIAEDYMKAIGFGEQPFLVYKHNDASHPHIHIVTTKIQADGSRIDTQNIGKNKSEPARIAIEKKYNLVEASKQNKKENTIKPADIIGNGGTKLETKNAIAKVLNAVLTNYNYTSIPELNAVLKNYHVTADRGKETSRVYQKDGLYYRLLDADGNKVSTPIKASLFYQNPGLKFLEKRFLENEKSRRPYRNLLKNKIDHALNSGINSIDELKEKLEQQKIQLVCRTNPEGIIYGLTYIDHENKYVFNGSKLGKAYSAKSIQERFQIETKQSFKETKKALLERNDYSKSDNFQPSNNFQNTFLQVLLQAENGYEPLPYQLKKSGKKKRRKNTTHL
ncbi:relaxase/mobilization nuclease domain-containing protein [Pedobacter arcticus]|uniref:relaxase/mobilization nuclease domain-containing protein n=1 Tax=Pedobacter arcticus TaxID=752140 RepID=UPI0004750968|nr:relaxase/mobilization nuclease domain-containing protein [Pedobacter arcticus]